MNGQRSKYRNYQMITRTVGKRMSNQGSREGGWEREGSYLGWLGNGPLWKWYTPNHKEHSMWIEGMWPTGQREKKGQMPWYKFMLEVFKEGQGGQWGWSRMSVGGFRKLAEGQFMQALITTWKFTPSEIWRIAEWHELVKGEIIRGHLCQRVWNGAGRPWRRCAQCTSSLEEPWPFELGQPQMFQELNLNTCNLLNKRFCLVIALATIILSQD